MKIWGCGAPNAPLEGKQQGAAPLRAAIGTQLDIENGFNGSEPVVAEFSSVAVNVFLLGIKQSVMVDNRVIDSFKGVSTFE